MALDHRLAILRATTTALTLATALLGVSTASEAQPVIGARTRATLSHPLVAQGQTTGLDEPAIATILAQARSKYRIPGMTAAVLQNGQMIVAADGLRQAKTAALVTTGDLWHLGSCGKAMTATLCARLVEKGVLTWNTEISEVFPELQGAMRFEYAGITLRELLAHRGGFPVGVPKKLERRIKQAHGTPAEIREQFLPELLKLKPVGRAGVSFTYSNVGYSIVGAMLERLTGYSYEELMLLEVFEPLGMSTAGFGEPRAGGDPNQPVGHTSKGKPVFPGSSLEPPSAGSPAGLIHMSMADWSRFAAVHLDEDGTQGFLSGASLHFLHQAFPGTAPQYALGWIRLSNGTDNILAHNGTNGYWYSVIALIPGRNLAFMVACNQGGKKADQATLAAINGIAAILGITLPPPPITRE